MHTLAILAPTFVDATPAQHARAHHAMMEQMMLLARGFSVDSPAVRSAAALVGSAVAPDLVEYELAPVEHDGPSPLYRQSPAGGTAEAVTVRTRPGSSSYGETGRGPGAPVGESRAPAPAVGGRDGDPGWKRGEGYARYLRTIMSTQPA